MKQKSLRKIGFWAATAMVVGSIIGVGVFFKNSSIVNLTKGDGISALVAWIIGAVLSLLAAISFSEFGRIKNLRITGFAGWAEKAVGKKYGYIIRFNYSFLYMAIYTTVMGVFVSESFFEGLKVVHAVHENLYVWQHILIGTAIGAIILTVNIVSVFTAGVIQQTATILKLIPIVLAIGVGLILANTNHGNANAPTHETGRETFTHFKWANLSGSIAAIPAILFAYDSFLGLSAIGNKTKGGTKTVTKAIIVGVIFSTVVYLLLAISSLLHVSHYAKDGVDKWDGSIENTLAQTLPTKWAEGLSCFIWMLIGVSALGVLNGFSAQSISTFEQSLKQDTFFGSKTLKARWGEKKTLVLYAFAGFAFWTILFGGFSIGLNTDSFWDAASNISSLIFFLNYGIVIMFYLIKRDKIDVEDKMKDRTFKIIAWMTVGGIFLVYAYLICYTFTTELIMNWNSTTSFGFYAGHQGDNIKSWVYFTIIWGGVALFFLMPMLNKWLTQKFEKRSVYE